MRSYIFTDVERKRLKSWLEEGVEDDATRMIFVAVRRDINRIRLDVELLSKVAQELRTEGRWDRRFRLPNDITRRLKTAISNAGGQVRNSG